MASADFENFRARFMRAFGRGEMGWANRMLTCLVAKRLAQGERLTNDLIMDVHGQAMRIAHASPLERDERELSALMDVLAPHEEAFKKLRDSGEIAELFVKIYGL